MFVGSFHVGTETVPLATVNAPVAGLVSASDDRNVQDGDTRLLMQLDRDPAPGFDFPGKLAFLGQDADLRRGEVGRLRAILLPA